LGVQDAEDRFTEAQTRLSEAEKQCQTNLVISEIKNETIATKKYYLSQMHLTQRKI
jgi:hypothetical protein